MGDNFENELKRRDLKKINLQPNTKFANINFILENKSIEGRLKGRYVNKLVGGVVRLLSGLR